MPASGCPSVTCLLGFIGQTPPIHCFVPRTPRQKYISFTPSTTVLVPPSRLWPFKSPVHGGDHIIEGMELLVHITAPSSRDDDQRAIRQARAYTSFVPVNSTLSRLPTNAAPLQDDLELVEPETTININLNTTVLSPSLFLDDTQLALTALESQIITSSLARAPLSDSDDWEQATPQPRRIQEPLHFAAPPSGFSFGDDSSSVIGSRKTLRSSQRPVRSSSISRAAVVPSSCDAGGLSSDETSPNARKRQCRTGDIASSPFVPPLREGDDWTVGYVGEPQILDPEQHTPSRLDDPRQTPRIQSSSSRGDDIPSQLPSTYSLSDVTSPSRGSDHLRDLVQTSPQQSSPFTPSRRLASRRTEVQSSPLLMRSRVVANTSQLPVIPPHVDRSNAKEDASVSSASVSMAYVPSAASRNMSSALPRDYARQDNAPSVLVPKTPFRSPSIHNQQGLHSSSAPVPETLMPPPPRRILDPTTPSATASEIATFSTLSWSISPAPPLTTSDSFKTHVTPNLRCLLKKHPSGEDVASRYNPQQVSRAICTSERGYWSINPRNWSVQQQIKFWRLLEEFVGSGKAGWGVWCTREQEIDMDSTKQIEGITSGLGQVKVFCWGEIVMHIYLALFITSNSRIRKATPVWIDADEKVVVRMQ